MRLRRSLIGMLLALAALTGLSAVTEAEARSELRVGARLTLICLGQRGLEGEISGRIGGASVGIIAPCIVPEQIVISDVVLFGGPEPHLVSWILALEVTASDGRTNTCHFTGRSLFAFRECRAIGDPNERVLLAITPVLQPPPEGD